MQWWWCCKCLNILHSHRRHHPHFDFGFAFYRTHAIVTLLSTCDLWHNRVRQLKQHFQCDTVWGPYPLICQCDHRPLEHVAASAREIQFNHMLKLISFASCDLGRGKFRYSGECTGTGTSSLLCVCVSAAFAWYRFNGLIRQSRSLSFVWSNGERMRLLNEMFCSHEHIPMQLRIIIISTFFICLFRHLSPALTWTAIVSSRQLQLHFSFPIKLFAGTKLFCARLSFDLLYFCCCCCCSDYPSTPSFVLSEMVHRWWWLITHITHSYTL